MFWEIELLLNSTGHGTFLTMCSLIVLQGDLTSLPAER